MKESSSNWFELHGQVARRTREAQEALDALTEAIVDRVAEHLGGQEAA